ncbi:hypothetical protein R1sor_005433 [Riccia sorocarpa]|uniref:Uncharacterized protein n=1 Tax=Riccia sorocarpa TaxID=122646 RepID=A0ABD3HN10_9MARC
MAGGQYRSLTGIIIWALVFAYTNLCVRGYSDENDVFSPCQDTTVRKHDGFTFGLLISRNDTFYAQDKNRNKIQLSPCDKRLNQLTSSQLAVFRPKVDEISLLIVNYTQVNPQNFGGVAVVFAGLNYAAVSPPIFLAGQLYRVTSMNLVLNFDKGRLANVLWKNDKCKSCQHGNSTFVCLLGGQCAVKATQCLPEGKIDCSLSIQAAWSGTDKNDNVLNSCISRNRFCYLNHKPIVRRAVGTGAKSVAYFGLLFGACLRVETRTEGQFEGQLLRRKLELQGQNHCCLLPFWQPSSVRSVNPQVNWLRSIIRCASDHFSCHEKGDETHLTLAVLEFSGVEADVLPFISGMGPYDPEESLRAHKPYYVLTVFTRGT